MRSFLSRDPKRSAEEALLAGDRKRAMDAFAESGSWQRAAQLASELGDDEKLVRFSMMGALGRLPPGRLPGPLAAAELLASQGHSAEAILLFERAGSYQKAAEAALAASDPLRASHSFKQAGAWLPAVRCLEAAGKLREALQTAEDGLRVQSRAVGGNLANPHSVAELNVARADLLLQLGRDEAGLKLLRSMAPSVRIAEMLELRGKLAEAVDSYLDLGKVEEAMRLALRSSDRDRLRAKILLRTGQPAEAGHLLAQLGLPREAAAAYEGAKDWTRAAYRWEAAVEPLRAAEAYEKAGRLRDAARCYLSAGMPARAAEITASSTEASKTRQVRGGQTLQKARQHLAAGEKSQAASLLLQIQPGDPGFAEGAVLLAPLLIEEGFGEDALSRLRLTPAGGTPQADSEREYWEGRSLEALGRREDAMSCFERVIARDPGHREARERLDGLRNPPPAPALAVAPWATAPSAAVPPPAAAAATTTATVAVPIVGGLLAGRYEILAELGRGGMGQVFKARDVELNEIVAIKALLSPGQSPQEEMRLLREVQICRRITHPNVVRVYDIGKFQGGLFVTMEFIEGRGLDELIEQDSPLPFDRIRFLLTEIASGLHEAHSQGIIHRDLKPGNIRVTATRLKILDFGIASMGGLGARLTHAGFVMGTPMYLAPDQILGGEPDSRSDLYSLGVVAYTMIAGREPYDTADINLLLLKQIHATPPHIRTFRPETTDPWAQFLDRLTAKDPRLRYQSAQEVLNVLEKLPV